MCGLLHIDSGTIRMFGKDPVADHRAQAFESVRAQHIAHIIECGPGKVLAGMVKRIDAEAVSATVFDSATLAEVKGLLA